MKTIVFAILAAVFCGCCTNDPLREGLVAEYRFSGDAVDSSGNGHDGEIQVGH